MVAPRRVHRSGARCPAQRVGPAPRPAPPPTSPGSPSAEDEPPSPCRRFPRRPRYQHDIAISQSVNAERSTLNPRKAAAPSDPQPPAYFDGWFRRQGEVEPGVTTWRRERSSLWATPSLLLLVQGERIGLDGRRARSCLNGERRAVRLTPPHRAFHRAGLTDTRGPRPTASRPDEGGAPASGSFTETASSLAAGGRSV